MSATTLEEIEQQEASMAEFEQDLELQAAERKNEQQSMLTRARVLFDELGELVQAMTDAGMPVGGALHNLGRARRIVLGEVTSRGGAPVSRSSSAGRSSRSPVLLAPIGPVVNLEVWAADLHKRLEEFVIDWRALSLKSPEIYPMEQTEADWYQQLAVHESSTEDSVDPVDVADED